MDVCNWISFGLLCLDRMSIPTQRPRAAEAEAAGLQGAPQWNQSGGCIHPIAPISVALAWKTGHYHVFLTTGFFFFYVSIISVGN